MPTAARIAVVGVSASGKTTFARALAKKLDLPLIHTDSVMWKPGWEQVDEAESAAALIAHSKKPAWIIEGYIPKSARSDVFAHADLIYYLDYPRHIPAWRYLIRSWRHRKDPRPELPGCYDHFAFKFLKIIWTKQETVSLLKYLAEVPKEKIVTLRTPVETQRYLREVY
ncbi:MAG: hypothetical protein AAB582_01050 [Patescibacteria group bacterium]